MISQRALVRHPSIEMYLMVLTALEICIPLEIIFVYSSKKKNSVCRKGILLMSLGRLKVISFVHITSAALKTFGCLFYSLPQSTLGIDLDPVNKFHAYQSSVECAFCLCWCFCL